MRRLEQLVCRACIAWVLTPQLAIGQGARSYCKGAEKHLAQDYDLKTIASAVFPAARIADRDDDCIYPLKILRYADADALIAVGNTPGEACHGCNASLSAYVLHRTPSGPKVVARFQDFSELGTFGDPGRIDAVQLGGNDAFSAEAGGTFQGYSSTSLTLFVFSGGRLTELTPSLPLSADDSGAQSEGRSAITVDGAWRAGAADITVDYKVMTGRRARSASATWALHGSRLDLVRGAVPLEYKKASGG